MAEELFKLSYVLKERRKANLITDAHVIASYPESEQRRHHAVTLIRETMLMATLGTIDHSVQYRVFSILAFAMPEPDAVLPR